MEFFQVCGAHGFGHCAWQGVVRCDPAWRRKLQGDTATVSPGWSTLKRQTSRCRDCGETRPARRLLELRLARVAGKRKKITWAPIGGDELAIGPPYCLGYPMCDVPSPCDTTCRIDPASKLCLGCKRTLDEIAAWSTFSREEKLAVLDELGARATRSDG